MFHLFNGLKQGRCFCTCKHIHNNNPLALDEKILNNVNFLFRMKGNNPLNER